MKTSFYFVLWVIAWLPAILLDIPFLNEYGFALAIVIFIIANYIIKRCLKTQIEHQEFCEWVVILEMVYNNEYNRHKRQYFIEMIVGFAFFIYMLLFFIGLFTLANVPLIDYILWGTFMISSGLFSLRGIKFYIQEIKTGKFISDKEFQDIFQDYKNERDTCTFEEMLLPQPKFYQAFNTANVVFAVLCVVIGLLTSMINYTYREDFQQGHELSFIAYTLYGLLAFYFGVKDLLNTSNNQKYILLLLSCILAALSYMPLTNYMNKEFLVTDIASSKDMYYDVKNNIVQETHNVNDIADFESSNIKKRSIVCFSFESYRWQLKRIIRANAEYQVVLKDTLGKKKIISIAPSELKEIYNGTKSYLETVLELLRVDLGQNKKGPDTRIYEDGEYIIIEITPYQIQPEDAKDRAADFTKFIIESYPIKSLDRGLKVRVICNNQQFIEHSLTVEEIRKGFADKSDNASSSFMFFDN